VTRGVGIGGMVPIFTSRTRDYYRLPEAKARAIALRNFRLVQQQARHRVDLEPFAEAAGLTLCSNPACREPVSSPGRRTCGSRDCTRARRAEAARAAGAAQRGRPKTAEQRAKIAAALRAKYQLDPRTRLLARRRLPAPEGIHRREQAHQRLGEQLSERLLHTRMADLALMGRLVTQDPGG
jgi:hypothetical protein